MGKTLNTIQTLSKIGWVLSRIAMVFCIVAGALCLVGIGMLAAGLDIIAKLGDVTVRGLVEFEAGMTAGQMYAAMICGAILAAAEAVTAGFAARYFKNELADGTPFTLSGAMQMRRLGIITVAVAIGASVVAGVAEAITGIQDTTADISGNVAAGILFIVVSVILRYGAELTGDVPTPKTEE